MRESWRRDLILIIFALVIASLLFKLAEQGSRRVEAAPVFAPTVTKTAIVASTPTPAVKSTVAVGDYVGPTPAAAAADTDVDLQETLDQILAALEYLAEDAYCRRHGTCPDAGQPTATPAHTVFEAAEPTEPTPAPSLSIWEDGSCWTPADMQVLALCGADAGDGYVVRWRGVPGDSRGPEIPDADYLAVRGGGDRLVWSGHHPATGEAVSVTYWSGGHVLAVHAAGGLLLRIDRNHFVTQ